MRKNFQLDFETLRNRAEENRWTPSLIAERTGLTASAIRRVFNGEVTPSATNLKAICETIEIAIDDVLIESDTARAAA